MIRKIKEILMGFCLILDDQNIYFSHRKTVEIQLDSRMSVKILSHPGNGYAFIS